MTVSAQTPRQEYAGNGATTLFALPFGGDDEDHIKASIDGVLLDKDVAYSVSALTESSGNVVFFVAPADGAEVVIWRETPIARPDDYAEHGILPASGVNADLDRLVFTVQENAAKYDRLLGASGNLQTIIDNIDEILEAAALINAVSVDSIASLRDVLGASVQYVHVLGYYAAGDGGGGLYRLVPGSAETDNGGTVIVGDDMSVWKMAVSGPTSIRQWGAKGDGVITSGLVSGTDDQPAIQAAIDWARTQTDSSRRILFPPGVYVLDGLSSSGTGHLLFNNAYGVILEGEGDQFWGTRLVATSTDKALLEVTGSSIACGLRKITLTRDHAIVAGAPVSKAIAGGDGIRFQNCYSNPNFTAEYVTSQLHYNGLHASTARMLISSWVGCSFVYNARHGVALPMNNEERFTNCVANSNGWYYSEAGGGSRVRASAGARGAGFRIGFDDADIVDGLAPVGGVYLSQCTAWENAGHGLHIEGGAARYQQIAVLVTGGFYDASGESGIFVKDAVSVHISGCRMSWNNERGIAIWSGATDVTVSSCASNINVMEGMLIYGSAKRVAVSAFEALGNDRANTTNAVGVRITGPCEDLAFSSCVLGNGESLVMSNGGYPGASVPDVTIVHDNQDYGFKLDKLDGYDSPTNIYINSCVFPGVADENRILYSTGTGTTFDGEVFTDIPRSWAPTITPSSGAFGVGGVTVNHATYTLTPESCSFSLMFTVTDDGTASGAIVVPMPVAAAYAATVLVGRNNATGELLVGTLDAANLTINNCASDGAFVTSSGASIDEAQFVISGTYRR